MCGCCPSSTCVFCLLNIKFQKKKWIWIVTGRRWADCRPRVCPTDRFYEWSNLINISQHRRLQTNTQHDPTKQKKLFLWFHGTSLRHLHLHLPTHTQGHTVQHTETHKTSYECGMAAEWWEKSERVTDGADDKTTTRRKNAAKQSVWNRNMYSRQKIQTKQVLLQMSNRSHGVKCQPLLQNNDSNKNTSHPARQTNNDIYEDALLLRATTPDTHSFNVVVVGWWRCDDTYSLSNNITLYLSLSQRTIIV